MVKNGVVEHNWPGSSTDHVWGAWYPKNNKELWRQCVHPDCNEIQTKIAKA